MSAVERDSVPRGTPVSTPAAPAPLTIVRSADAMVCEGDVCFVPGSSDN